MPNKVRWLCTRDHRQCDPFGRPDGTGPVLGRGDSELLERDCPDGTVAHSLTTAQSARLFALLNLTIAEGVIGFYDAKYTYQFWRPVTAIRAADTDDNPETMADPTWTPLTGTTPPDPSYPGAHAVVSAAGAAVLTFFFDRDDSSFAVSSEVLPEVERSFTSFTAAAD